MQVTNRARIHEVLPLTTAAATPAKADRFDPTPGRARPVIPAQGNAVVLRASLANERDYLPALRSMLERAERSIDIVAYNFFSENGAVRALAEQLIKKHEAGVKVRVVIEGDHVERNKPTIELLRAAGITVIEDGAGRVTHAKGVSIDGKEVLAGSSNLTNTSLGKNNETNLHLEDPALAHAFTSHLDHLGDTLIDSTTTSGDVTLLTDRAFQPALLELIDGAKTTLDVATYYLNHAVIRERLAAAAARGVKVRVFLEQSNEDFAPQITEANQRAAEALRAAGVEVVFDRPEQISHQKFVVRDGQEALMGSSNLSKTDIDDRHQLNWRVRNQAIAAELVRWLDGKASMPMEPDPT